MVEMVEMVEMVKMVEGVKMVELLVQTARDVVQQC